MTVQPGMTACRSQSRSNCTRRLSALLTYTWSHDINTVEWDGTGQNPNDYGCLVVCEKATSLLNQTNRASLSATYQLPYGFMLSGWVQAASGFPFNITTGVDNNGDGNTSDRPVINGAVIGRDAGQVAGNLRLRLGAAEVLSHDGALQPDIARGVVQHLQSPEPL